MNVTNLGRSSIYNYMAEGRFPKTVSLGGRAVAWVESEITDWMLERVSGRHSYLNK
ncbi:TPA: AlpA family phage regulatory protein [Photobacterium damselae]